MKKKVKTIKKMSTGKKQFITLGMVLVIAVAILAVVILVYYVIPRGTRKVSVDGYEYQYKNVKSDFDSVLFAKTSQLIPAYKIKDKGVSLSMVYKPANPKDSYEVVEAQDNLKNSITFKDVEENTNIIYTILNDNAVKEEIELTAFPTSNISAEEEAGIGIVPLVKSDQRIIYTFELEVEGLSYVKDETGAVIPIFYDKNGNEYGIPLPYMIDAQGSISNNVKISITQKEPENPNILEAKVEPDVNWLKNSTRVYPVKIDPTVVKGNAPVSRWGINEGYGSLTNDVLSNANHLTITNSQWRVNSTGSNDGVGKVSLYFDGDGDYLSRAYDADFNFGTGSFTVSLWAKIPSVAAGTAVLLSRYNEAGFKIYLNDNENICFGIDDDSTWGPDDSACSSSTYNDSRWHHIEAVKSGTDSITLYIDGVMVNANASTGADSSLSGTSPVLYFGIDSDGASNDYQGDLDSIAIYDYARDENQVKADAFAKPQTVVLFGQDEETFTEGMLGHWKLDETTENTCPGGEDSCDSSGNNRDGTFYGDPAIGDGGKFGNSVNFDGTGDYIDLGDIDL